MCALRPSRVPDTAALFPRLLETLLSLLRTLTQEDWDAPTVAGQWRVRDVAAHLLDGELRTLAAHRDDHRIDDGAAPSSYADVNALIQRLNASGVAFGRRLSPHLLVDLLAVSGRWMGDFVLTLDPEAAALFSVAWAGEEQSTNRFDTAREFTERWHHQMQIRLALGTRGTPELLLAKEFSVPLLRTAIQVLPHAYRAVDAQEGTTITLQVAESAQPELHGEAGDLAWTLRREGKRWRLYEGIDEGEHSAGIVASTAMLWRLFFNALPPAEIPSGFVASGPEALIRPLWAARAVMV